MTEQKREWKPGDVRVRRAKWGWRERTVVACVNPDHLEPVTRAENIRRGMRWPSEKASA